ncbi:5741_t:CDS:2 [Funneliformis caledonium]|uniref:5741_t:CDS:1 n=1 Tax=Funneliformis caledonium TaxID=1117310 RepID=A0A9N9DJ38_9GLOM|nr:5741_t:CDS:2 [Funneliformis caledonium]
MIRELSIQPTSELSICAPSEGSDIGEVSIQFHKLYYDIDIAEKNVDRNNRELICFIFVSGKRFAKQSPTNSAYKAERRMIGEDKNFEHFTALQSRVTLAPTKLPQRNKQKSPEK